MASRNGRPVYIFDHDSDNDIDGILADLADRIEASLAPYDQRNGQRWLQSIAERNVVVPCGRGLISLQSARDFYYSRERDQNLGEPLPRYEQRNYTIPTATLPPAYTPDSGSSSLRAPPAEGSASRSPSPTAGPRPKATFPNGPLITLSLDAGGGNRTTKQLEMLEMLMRKISGNIGRNCSVPANILKPCDVFHLIVGHGTGGLVAILLGRLRMSVREVKEFYEEIEKDVFGPWMNMKDAISMYEPGLGDKLREIGEAIGVRPSSDRSRATKQLEEKVGRLVQIRNMGTAFHESDAPLGRVLVAAECETASGRFRRVSLCTAPNVAQDIKPSIVEAVRVTMAHMPFFKPAKILDVPGKFHGSRIGFTNPVDILDQDPDPGIARFALRPPLVRPIPPRVHVSIGAVVPDDDEVQSAQIAADMRQQAWQLPDKMTFDELMDLNARLCANFEDRAGFLTGSRHGFGQRDGEPDPLRYFRLNHSTQHMRGLEGAADMAARAIGDIRRDCIRSERSRAAAVQRPSGAPGVR